MPDLGVGVAAGSALDGSLARIVHDLRAPLQAIRGECFTLSRRAASGRQRAGLRAIDAEAVRLSTALDDLLRVATARPPAPSRAPILADLADLAEAAGRRGAAVGRPGGVRVRVRVDPGPRPLVVADPGAVARALDNLVGNAVRHSPRARRVTIEAGVRAAEARVVVRDQGPGVPPEDRERIFRARERGRDPIGAGAGLGLAIARDVVEAHGGRLVLLDERPGAAFLLALPLAGR